MSKIVYIEDYREEKREDREIKSKEIEFVGYMLSDEQLEKSVEEVIGKYLRE